MKTTVNPHLIPSYDMLGLPAPPWLAQALMALTLALHWTFLGGVVGGTALLLANARRARTNPDQAELSRRLTPFLPFFLSMAMTLGIAPLLFVQVLYGQFFYTANILLGWWWLGMLGLLLAAFALLWLGWHRQAEGRPLGLVLPALVLLVLAKAAVVLSSNATLTQSPEAWQATWARGMNRLFTGDPTLVPRVAFALTGFVAMGGLLVAVLAQMGLLPKAGRRAGASLALPSLGLQLAFWFWLMASLPPAQGERLMAARGEGAFWWVATAAFLAAVPMAVLVWRGGGLAGLIAAAVVQFGGLLAWALTRDNLRRAALEPVYSPASVPVHPEWSSFALFAVVFVVGLGVIGWLVKQSLPAAKA